jgi:hypothetical protein
MKFLTIILFLFIIPCLLFSDQFIFKEKFKSSNGNYILKPKTSSNFPSYGEEWVLVDSISNKNIYNIKENLSQKSAYISDDGRKIITINSWPIGRPEKDRIVLRFYIDGKEVNNYCLDDLLDSIRNTSLSVSHFSWFFHKTLEIKNWKTLSLKTFELKTITFDLSDGKIASVELDPRIDSETLYLYGKLKRIKKGLWKIEISHSVFDNILDDTVLEFELENDDYKREKLPKDGIILKGKLHHNHYYAILIKDGKFIDKVNVILNYFEP